MKTNIPIPGRLSLFFGFCMLLAGAGLGQTQHIFSTPGTHSFTIPAGVSQIIVEAWGGGGGGGGRPPLTSLPYYAAGGGGGAYARQLLQVLPGQQYTVVTAIGGNGGEAGNNPGMPGQASLFYLDQANPLLRAAGGQGGTFTDPVAGQGGAGGSVENSIGNPDWVFAGGNGARGGGGAAGYAGPGGNASGATGGAGTLPWGGNGATIGAASSDGFPGMEYGGAGSGARALSDGVGRKGGQGAQGLVIITLVQPMLLINGMPAYPGNTAVCSAQNVTIELGVLPGDPLPVDIQWIINNNPLHPLSGTETAVTPPYTLFTAPSTQPVHSVELTVENNSTYSSTDQYTFSYLELPTASITGSAGCDGFSTLNVTLSGLGPWSYAWSDDGGETSHERTTLESPDVFITDYERRTTYSIATVSDANCVNQANQTSVTISTGPMTSIRQSDVAGLCDGQIFEADILVSDFNGVGSMNLTLVYDTLMLDYIDFTPIPGLLPNNFVVDAMITHGQGIISASAYVGEAQEALTLPDESVLFTLSFRYKHSGDGTGTLQWYYDENDPVYNQYSSAAPEYKPMCCIPHNDFFIDASLLGNKLPEVAVAYNGQVAGVDAAFEYCWDTPVALTLHSIAMGMPPFTVSWEVFVNGSVTADLMLSGTKNNITAIGDVIFNKTLQDGEYLVQITSITDANGCAMDKQDLGTSITILAEPAIDILVDMDAGTGSDYEICYGIGLNLNVQGEVGAPNWSFEYKVEGSDYLYSDEIVLAAEAIHLIELPGSLAHGIYQFTALSLSDGKGCEASIASLTSYGFSVEVLPQPEVILSFNGELINEQYEWLYNTEVIINLSEISSGVLPLDFTWNITGENEFSYPGSTTSVGLNGVILDNLQLDPGAYEIQFTMVRDAKGCILSEQLLSDLTTTLVIHPAFSISGNIYYHHRTINQVDVDLPMEGAIVKLMQNGDEKYIAQVNDEGYYFIPNVTPGIYDIEFGAIPGGGINVTDAALVNYWSVFPSSIEKVQFFAGDVNGLDFLETGPDNILGADDASMIQDYFQSFIGFEFPRGRWTFWKKGDYISENPGLPVYEVSGHSVLVEFGQPSITEDFYGLVIGDFNRSHNPGIIQKSHLQVLDLTHEEIWEVNGLVEFELPIYAGKVMEVGAISLILDIPEGLILSGVYLGGNPDSMLDFGIWGNQVRIGWYSLAPLHLIDGDRLLTLQLKTNEISGDEPLYITLVNDPLNELADGSYKVITDAEIKTGVIQSSGLAIQKPNIYKGLTLENYPNPFRGKTNFHYFAPFGGKVTLEIHSLKGNMVARVVEYQQTAGEFTLAMDWGNLKPGVYSATITIEGNSEILDRTILIVCQ